LNRLCGTLVGKRRLRYGLWKKVPFVNRGILGLAEFIHILITQNTKKQAWTQIYTYFKSVFIMSRSWKSRQWVDAYAT